MGARGHKRIASLALAGMMLAWLLLHAPGAQGAPELDVREWEPAPGASELEFRGLRMGMNMREVEAAGFRRGRVLGHASGAIGYALIPQRPDGLRRVTAYFVHEALFELSATFEPMPEGRARAVTEALYRALRAPPAAADGLFRVARWTHERVIVRYSAQPAGDGRFAPDLLLQDETGYLEARVYFSQIEYSH